MFKVSIIIPAKNINSNNITSIPKILDLKYLNYEILIFVDKNKKKLRFKRTRIIATGKIGPAQKRNLALKYAKGSLLAFLDDDAYPSPNWLNKAVIYFKNKKIAAVGGPAVTPKEDSFWQKLSGAVFESILGGGTTRNRYLSIGKVKKIDDWPTVNLLVRKTIFRKINGFNVNCWPGEDTKLCLDIINNNWQIIYDPKVIVYHHRRSNLWNHFKQISNYASQRGFFAKKHPQTSLRLSYFIPTLFVGYLILVLVKFPLTLPLWIYLFGLIIDGTIASLRYHNLLIGIFLIPMIFVTHIVYGLSFFWSLFFKPTYGKK